MLINKILRENNIKSQHQRWGRKDKKKEPGACEGVVMLRSPENNVVGIDMINRCEKQRKSKIKKEIHY